MNVKLSPELERRVAEHVALHTEYPTAEAFVERAVALFLESQTETERLELLLAAGVDSSPQEFADSDWEDIRSTGQRLLDERKAAIQS